MQRSRRKILLGSATVLGLAALLKGRGLKFGVSDSVSDSFGGVNSAGFLRGGVIRRPVGFSRNSYYPASYFPKSEVFQFDVRNLKAAAISTLSAPHVVETHSFENHVSVVGTQRTDTIALIDWKSGRQITSRTLANRAYYYGHSIFSKDGNRVLSSVVQPTDARSFIEILDYPSFKVIDEVEVEGGIVHEIAHLENETFVFGLTPFFAASIRPAFGLLDLAHKSVTYIEVPFADRKGAFSHLYKSGESVYADLLVDGPVSRQRLSGRNDQVTRLLNLDLKSNTVFELTGTADQMLRSQALSLAVDDSERTLWVSFPDLAKIQIWSLESSSVIETIDFSEKSSPRGIAFDRESGRMLVSSERSILVFKSKTRKPVTDVVLPTSGYCAHLRIS